MTYPNFFDEDCEFKVSSYYYRVEFQQRGAPHIHTLLWLQDSDGKEAPTFWTADSEDDGKERQEEKIVDIEKIATMLISGSEDTAFCDYHHKKSKLKTGQTTSTNKKCESCYSAESDFEECLNHKMVLEGGEGCNECMNIRKLVRDFQTHKHTFSCQKKNKVFTIRKHEGHGKNDGKFEGPKISNYVHCRYNFPQFPLNRTKLILGMSKSLDEKDVKQRRNDLQKIRKYLIRQTYSENPTNLENLDLEYFRNLTFLEFLQDVGMFSSEKQLGKYTAKEKNDAYNRYINALSAPIRGTSAVILKRGTKDVFTNNYNRNLMKIHKANHDIQMVVDQVRSLILRLYSMSKLIMFLVCLCPVCCRLPHQE